MSGDWAARNAPRTEPPFGLLGDLLNALLAHDGPTVTMTTGLATWAYHEIDTLRSEVEKLRTEYRRG